MAALTVITNSSFGFHPIFNNFRRATKKTVHNISPLTKEGRGSSILSSPSSFLDPRLFKAGVPTLPGLSGEFRARAAPGACRGGAFHHGSSSMRNRPLAALDNLYAV